MNTEKEWVVVDQQHEIDVEQQIILPRISDEQIYEYSVLILAYLMSTVDNQHNVENLGMDQFLLEVTALTDCMIENISDNISLEIIDIALTENNADLIYGVLISCFN